MWKKRGQNELYLSQVVDNIKKVTKKNSPPKETKKKPSLKQKETSPFKPSLKRKQSSPRSSTKPRKIWSQKESIPKEKEKMKCLHQSFILYKPEINRRYCKKGMDLDGVKCSKCHVKFGMPQQPPSNMQPIWICCNRRSSHCTHSLCGTCYFDLCNDKPINGYARRWTRS